jgi:hypothetical protein
MGETQFMLCFCDDTEKERAAGEVDGEVLAEAKQTKFRIHPVVAGQVTAL